MELRAAVTDLDMRGVPGAGAQLVGYAARFNVETIIAGMFREQIAPRAFRKTLREHDIRALGQHDPAAVVGRSKGGPRNLRLEEDADGLYATLDVPGTPTARSLYADIEAGLIDGMSFAFDTVEDRWDETDSATLPLRTLKEVRLYEVSYVTFPAYETTSVEARAILAARQTLILPDTIETNADAPSAEDGDTETTTPPDSPPEPPLITEEHHDEPTTPPEPAPTVIVYPFV